MRIKPYDPSKPATLRKPRSPGQELAFRVFKLRGLHAFSVLLTGERRAQMAALVDEELALLGAETEATRRARREAEWDAELAATPPTFEEVAS